MRQFLLGVLLLPALAQAQPVTVEKPVICDKVEIVIRGLQDGQYQEQPFWIGVDDLSRYTLFTNPKTRTWTLVQFNDRIACILGAGEGSRAIITGPKT